MIVIVNYGIGNLDSVLRAFRKCQAEAQVSNRLPDIDKADGIVLPGVGSFDPAMATLRNEGLIPILNRKVLQEHTPILGICLGFQLFSHSSEEGETEGLGWIHGETRRFRHEAQGYKIPHMGWNDVTFRRETPFTEGVKPPGAAFYFAHSYAVSCRDEAAILATTDYGVEFVSAVQQDNIIGTQFHPEKSHANGLKLIENFVKICHNHA